MVTNKEIQKKHSLNPEGAVEEMDCSLDTLMDEARAATLEEVKPLVDLLNEWLDTPYFKTRTDWERWVTEYSPRVKEKIAEFEQKLSSLRKVGK
jgi:hypothetical protein